MHFAFGFLTEGEMRKWLIDNWLRKTVYTVVQWMWMPLRSIPRNQVI